MSSPFVIIGGSPSDGNGATDRRRARVVVVAAAAAVRRARQERSNSVDRPAEPRSVQGWVQWQGSQVCQATDGSKLILRH